MEKTKPAFYNKNRQKQSPCFRNTTLNYRRMVTLKIWQVSFFTTFVMHIGIDSDEFIN